MIEPPLPRYLAAATLVVLIGLVLGRVAVMRRQGIGAMHFGRRDRSDFVIPPLALFYVYLIFATAFDWPSPSRQRFFDSAFLNWMGVILCALGLAIFAWSLISFGRSFRVGIDSANPDRLVTTGAFALSRNPIYVAFGVILVGECLIVPNWIVLLYLLAGILLFHRQVVREEAYLKLHYQGAYQDYCRRVPRYV